MVSKIWTVNIVMFVVILIGSIKSYDVWFSDQFYSEQETIDEPQHKPGVKSGVEIKKMQPISFYNAIVEKNLFFEDRVGIEDKDSQTIPKTTGRKISEEEVMLYGIMITGNKKQALISNPFAESDENKTTWVKVDEQITDGPGKSVIKVENILKDKIVISIEGKEFDRFLYESKGNQDQQNVPVSKKSENDKTPKRDVQLRPTFDDNPIPHGDPTRNTSAPAFEISPDGKYKIFDTPFGKIKRRIN